MKFGVGELGSFTLRCERPFTPIRWALRREGNKYVARLFDDSGHTGQPTISRAAFESPCNEQEVPSEAEIHVPDHGGMYIARTQTDTAAVIAPPVLPRGSGFTALSLNPEIKRLRRSTDSAMKIIEIAGIWSRARLPGNLLAAIRRQQVMKALAAELFRLVCGDNWTRAEEQTDLRGETLGPWKPYPGRYPGTLQRPAPAMLFSATRKRWLSMIAVVGSNILPHWRSRTGCFHRASSGWRLANRSQQALAHLVGLQNLPLDLQAILPALRAGRALPCAPG